MKSQTVEFIDDLVMTWNNALHLLIQNQIQDAYSLILSTNDDLYLLRLMAKTGVCYQLLNPETRIELKTRITKIQNAKFFNELVDQFLPKTATPNNLGQNYDSTLILEETQDYSRHNNPSLSQTENGSSIGDVIRAQQLMKNLQNRIAYAQ